MSVHNLPIPSTAETLRSTTAHLKYSHLIDNQMNFKDAKIKRVAFAVLAVIVFMAANSALGLGGLVSLIIGVPLTIVTIAIVLRVFKVKFYANSTILTTYREQAAKAPLLEVIRNHGLENIFKHSLLTESLFQEKYTALCNSLNDVFKVIDFYEVTKKAADKAESSYHIPEPKHFHEMLLDLREMNATKAFQTMDIPKLARYDLITAEFEEGYQDYKQAKELEKKHHLMADKRLKEEGLALLSEVQESIKASDNSDEAYSKLCSLAREMKHQLDKDIWGKGIVVSIENPFDDSTPVSLLGKAFVEKELKLSANWKEIVENLENFWSQYEISTNDEYDDSKSPRLFYFF